MSQFESPFLAVPVSDWLCSNDLAFAIFDGFPVSPGHVLVTTRRIDRGVVVVLGWEKLFLELCRIYHSIPIRFAYL